MRNRRWADLLAWVGLLAMGFFSSLFVLTLLRDLVLLAARVLLPAQQAASLAAPSALWTLALTALITLAGLVIARRRPRVVDVEIPVADLPQGLHGFLDRSDQRCTWGPTIKREFVEGVVARVNGLKADLIAVTGDLVDGSVKDLSMHTAPLAGLSARHGAYFVTGNHEYYSGERAWSAEIRRLGLRVLKNEHVVLKHNGESLVLAGVTDLSAHHFDAAERTATRLRRSAGAPAPCRSKNLARSSTQFRASCGRRGLRCANLRAYPWRPVLAMEFLRAFFPALHRRPVSIEESVGLREPRHGILGTAESLRRPLGNHSHSPDARDTVIRSPCQASWLGVSAVMPSFNSS